MAHIYNILEVEPGGFIRCDEVYDIISRVGFIRYKNIRISRKKEEFINKINRTQARRYRLLYRIYLIIELEHFHFGKEGINVKTIKGLRQEDCFFIELQRRLEI